MPARVLTAGERTAAAGVFGGAIDLDRVVLHDRPFIPFQPKGTAIAPNGAVYFHARDILPDFSTGWRSMAWLVHELTHVWQHQSGQWVLLRGLFERRYSYGTLDPARPFHRRGIEQQAAIVEDWFRLSRGQPPYRGRGSEADYRAAIPFVGGAA